MLILLLKYICIQTGEMILKKNFLITILGLRRDFALYGTSGFAFQVVGPTKMY